MKNMLFNYFVIQTIQRDRVVAIQVVRTPIGEGWPRDNAQHYAGRGRWVGVDDKRSKNYKAQTTAIAAMRRLARSERKKESK